MAVGQIRREKEGEYGSIKTQLHQGHGSHGRVCGCGRRLSGVRKRWRRGIERGQQRGSFQRGQLCGGFQRRFERGGQLCGLERSKQRGIERGQQCSQQRS